MGSFGQNLVHRTGLNDKATKAQSQIEPTGNGER
jgi:hypothetical protein